MPVFDSLILLYTLQVLSKLEIVIPLYFIFSIFREGIRPKSEKVPKRGSVSTQSRDNENASKDVIGICKSQIQFMKHLYI